MADGIPIWLPERMKVHSLYFFKLCDIINHATTMDSPTLDASQLESLSVRVLDELNIDEKGPVDFSPRYFVPMPENDLYRVYAQACVKAKPYWEHHCRGGEVKHTAEDDYFNLDPTRQWCKPFDEAIRRQRWLTTVFFGRSTDTSIADRTGWEQFVIAPEPLYYRSCQHEFSAGWHFIIRDDVLPHSTGCLRDSCEAGSAILRSEVMVAAQLLKQQIRYWKHIGHHTMPVLLVSIQHDAAARITQVHFDGEYMYLRPSRTLNLASDTPTADAFLLVRWLCSTPIGETAYAEQPEPSEEIDEAFAIQMGNPQTP